MIAVSVIKLTQGRDEGERPDSWEKAAAAASVLRWERTKGHGSQPWPLCPTAG